MPGGPFRLTARSTMDTFWPRAWRSLAARTPSEQEKTRHEALFFCGLVVVSLCLCSPAMAAPPAVRANAAVESATEVLKAMSAASPRAIPRTLLEGRRGS